jgi:hypothetical protein
MRGPGSIQTQPTITPLPCQLERWNGMNNNKLIVSTKQERFINTHLVLLGHKMRDFSPSGGRILRGYDSRACQSARRERDL